MFREHRTSIVGHRKKFYMSVTAFKAIKVKISHSVRALTYLLILTCFANCDHKTISKEYTNKIYFRKFRRYRKNLLFSLFLTEKHKTVNLILIGSLSEEKSLPHTLSRACHLISLWYSHNYCHALLGTKLDRKFC